MRSLARWPAALAAAAALSGSLPVAAQRPAAATPPPAPTAAKTPATAPTMAPTYTVARDGVNVRARPTAESGVVITLAKGTVVARDLSRRIDGEWLPVLVGPRPGYVALKYLTPVTPAASSTVGTTPAAPVASSPSRDTTRAAPSRPAPRQAGAQPSHAPRAPFRAPRLGVDIGLVGLAVRGRTADADPHFGGGVFASVALAEGRGLGVLVLPTVGFSGGYTSTATVAALRSPSLRAGPLEGAVLAGYGWYHESLADDSPDRLPLNARAWSGRGLAAGATLTLRLGPVRALYAPIYQLGRADAIAGETPSIHFLRHQIGFTR